MPAITKHCDRNMKYADGGSIINHTRKYLPKPEAFLSVSTSRVTQTRLYPSCIQLAVCLNININIFNIAGCQLHESEIQCCPNGLLAKAMKCRNPVRVTNWPWVLYFVDRASRYKFLGKTNLTHFFMYLFISCLYMFRASQRSSSGGRIELIHHLV